MAIPLNISSYGAPIAAGQSLSSGYTVAFPTGITGSVATGGVAMGGDTIVAIMMPSGWTAAPITFQASYDGGTTWGELYDDTGAEVVIAAPPAGAFIALTSRPSYTWRGVTMLKVRSGTSAAPVNQVSNVTVTLIGRPEIF